MPAIAAGRPGAHGSRWPRLVAAAARRHWLLALLLAAGLVLRVLTQIAYRPALFYIDSVKYLFGAYPGNDPPGYQLLLKAFLAVANLDMVAVVQHLLGLGMAVALYALLVRRRAPLWLAALAAAPVLLDGYELQMEQTVMPDVLFEVLLVAGLVVLLWQPRPRLWQVAVGGLLLGSTATMWEPGEVLILPALVFVVIVAAGWRRTLRDGVVVCVAFAVPILACCYRDYLAYRQFSLAPLAGSTIYGRMAYAADCQTLKLPAYERVLCPPRQVALRLGPDQLVHVWPVFKFYRAPQGMTQHGVATDFSRRVLEQQPLRVAGSVLSDAVKLFEVRRVTSAGDTPISRWQFQDTFPTFYPYVTIHDGALLFGDRDRRGVPQPLGTGAQYGGRNVKVITPLAKFLRAYQLDGGYTPGPLLLFALLAGLAGSAFLLRRRKRMEPADRDTARACCYVLASAVVLLLLSDLFEFSWRYQLPAIVTLPPAGALGIAVIIGYVRSLRRPGAVQPSPATAAGPPSAAWDGTAAAPPNGKSADGKGGQLREPQGRNRTSAG